MRLQKTDWILIQSAQEQCMVHPQPSEKGPFCCEPCHNRSGAGTCKSCVYHIFKFIHLISHIGWGLGSCSDNLYQVHLELRNQSDCDSLLNDYFYFYPNIFHPELIICAGDVVNSNRSVCSVGNQHTRMNVKKVSEHRN